MAIRRIVEEGSDDVLRKHARTVERFNKRLHTLLDDMRETMYDADGVGLAAPQVGVLRRAVVIDVGEGPLELINPVIVEADGAVVREEGCLSVPGRRGTVERPEHVVVEAQDRHGKPIRVEGRDWLAVAMCHEIDHLDGILYIDRMIEDVTDRSGGEEPAGEDEE